MKKYLSLFLIPVLFWGVIVGAGGNIKATAATTTATVLKGDANDDNVIDIRDVLLLRRHYVGYDDKINKEAADYNSDSEINGMDILFVRKKIAGLEDIEKNVPANYLNKLSENVQVNQIGYETDSAKLAKLCESGDSAKADSVISAVRCYVVSEADNSVVFSDVSTSRKYDLVTEKYVSTFDFSSIKEKGNYKIFTPSGYSYSFKIDDNPYKDVQKGLITALYYNRCGVALTTDVVDEKYAHDVCHSGDVPVYILNKLDTDPNSDTYGKYIQSTVGKASDFLGGLHDAGDYGRYTTPANQVVADLLMTYEMYGETADCTVMPGSQSDLLEEAKHEMQWLLTMQNKATGGVYWRIATNGFTFYGNKPDEDLCFEQTGFYVSHETLKATAGFVGAAALCARVYKDIDTEFSAKCLEAAKSGYLYVKENMEDPDAHKAFSNDSEYPAVNAGSYGDNPTAWGDIWWAACELYRTTGETGYKTDAESLLSRRDEKEISFSLSTIDAYSTAGAGSFAYLMANKDDSEVKSKIMKELTDTADNYLKTAENDRYNTLLGKTGDFVWGSNQELCVRIKVMAIVDYMNKTNKYESAIRDSVCYILGRNAVNKSYITGFGSDTPVDICHGPSAHLRVEYNLYTPAPGFMVGGAVQNGANYEDLHDNYACNEVCVYWNSSAILAFGYIVNVDSAK